MSVEKGNVGGVIFTNEHFWSFEVERSVHCA